MILSRIGFVTALLLSAAHAQAQTLQEQIDELRQQNIETRLLMAEKDRQHENALKQLALNGVPIGTIMPFAGPLTSFPRGWLLCDGERVGRSQYPLLFAAIGTSWGSDDATTFRVPDLRGRFLRGVDKSWDGQGSTGRDPELVGRAAAYPGGNTGASPFTDPVGSVQGSATGKPKDLMIAGGGHVHDAHPYQPIIILGRGGISVDNHGDGRRGNATLADNILDRDSQHSHSLTNWDSETRPQNAYVHFIIKAWFIDPNPVAPSPTAAPGAIAPNPLALGPLQIAGGN